MKRKKANHKKRQNERKSKKENDFMLSDEDQDLHEKYFFIHDDIESENDRKKKSKRQ